MTSVDILNSIWDPTRNVNILEVTRKSKIKFKKIVPTQICVKIRSIRLSIANQECAMGYKISFFPVGKSVQKNMNKTEFHVQPLLIY